MALSPYILRHFEKRQGKTENFLNFFTIHFFLFTFSLFPVSGLASNKKNKAAKTVFHIYCNRLKLKKLPQWRFYYKYSFICRRSKGSPAPRVYLLWFAGRGGTALRVCNRISIHATRRVHLCKYFISCIQYSCRMNMPPNSFHPTDNSVHCCHG